MAMGGYHYNNFKSVLIKPQLAAPFVRFIPTKWRIDEFLGLIRNIDKEKMPTGSTNEKN